MNRYVRHVWIAIMAGMLLLAGCSQPEKNQRGSGVTPTNSLPEVVQPIGTGTPSSAQGLLPKTPGVVVPGAGTPGAGTPPAASGPAGAQKTIGAILATDLGTLRLASTSGEVGLIQGLVLDPGSGQLQYLAIETKGMNAKPNRQVLVPWGAFQVVTLPKDLKNQATAPAVYLSDAAGDISGVPEVDFNNLKSAQHLNPGWDADVRQFWASKSPGLPVTGAQPESSPAPLWVGNASRMSLQIPVVDGHGKDLGHARDFILNSDGQVSFVLIRPATLLDFGSSLAPVPWKQMKWLAEKQAFQMNVSEQALKNAPRFDPNNVPAMASPGWDASWTKYWQGVH